MRIGILTFHFVPNQGAVLQCCATKKVLEKNGHEAVVIDYRPAYHTVRYSAHKNPFRYAAWFRRRSRGCGALSGALIYARSFARACVMNLRRSDREVQRCFSDFVSRNLPLTERYLSLRQLREHPPELDAYLCGSDQLWNPQLLDQCFDRAYFLDFGKKELPRVAYAVSMGQVQDESRLSELKDCCKGLSAVSLREYDRNAAAATGRDVHICLDPTLLLDAGDYADLESPETEREPYIFVFGFEDTAALQQALSRVREQCGCRVINGSPHRIACEDAVKLRNYGPDRFLTLIKNARYVVTNSFHASALSVVYHKDFITVAHSTRGVRMIELLGRLGLTRRLWGSEDFSLSAPVDWERVEEKRGALREHSLTYLLSALGGTPGERIPHWEGERFSPPPDPYEGCRAWAGFRTDPAALRESASGGAAAALAGCVLKEGGCVFGAAYTEDFKSAVYVSAETPEELRRIKGSKYIPAEKSVNGSPVFERIGTMLTEGRTVLFMGLPCDVGALKSWMRRREIPDEKLLTMDLICHGPTTREVQAAYVEQLEARFGSKLRRFSTREVKKSWSLPYLRAEFENGKVFSKPLYETELGFALKYYARSACYACGYKGKNHAADLTVGDYWGLKPGDRLYNRDGVSLIVSRTEKGEALVRKLDPAEFTLAETELRAAIRGNPMFEESAKKQSFTARFETELREKGLHAAVTGSPGYRVFRKAALKNRMLVLSGQR